MRAQMFSLALVSSVALAGPLNDTGIDFCRDYATGVDTPVTSATTCADGQDARYGRDPAVQRGAITKVGGGSKGFDFTKIANNGSTLPASAALGSNPTDWACTYDNNTGLMWEVKTTSGLRSQNHTYTWYDSVHNYGGNPGTASGGTCQTAGRCDTEKFVADVNAANLCSHNDWRMPTVDELWDLVDIGTDLPWVVIDTTYFPNTPASSYFWSGTPYVAASDGAWLVTNSSSWYWDNRSNTHSVRLVRAGR